MLLAVVITGFSNLGLTRESSVEVTVRLFAATVRNGLAHS